MSKPGGTPIQKRRPFFKDKNIAIYTILGPDSKIVAFEIEINNLGLKTKAGEEIWTRKIFNVKDNQILKAWQELQTYADPIVGNLLSPLPKKKNGLVKRK